MCEKVSKNENDIKLWIVQSFLCSFKCMASVLQELRSCHDDAIAVVDIVS